MYYIENFLEKYWWTLLIFAVVLSVFLTLKYQPDYDSYQLSGKYKVEAKMKQHKTRVLMTAVSNGKSVTMVPIVTPYTEYTFKVSNGKIYQQENNEEDHLGVAINEGDELYVYVSDASGWGDSDVLSHQEMTSRDFMDNTSLFWNGVKIFLLIVLGMAVLVAAVLLIGMFFD